MKRQSKRNTKEVRSYENKPIKAELGKTYSAIGICGTTDGEEVTGVLIELDNSGAYLTGDNGMVCLCNERTLQPI